MAMILDEVKLGRKKKGLLPPRNNNLSKLTVFKYFVLFFTEVSEEKIRRTKEQNYIILPDVIESDLH